MDKLLPFFFFFLIIWSHKLANSSDSFWSFFEFVEKFFFSTGFFEDEDADEGEASWKALEAAGAKKAEGGKDQGGGEQAVVVVEEVGLHLEEDSED